MSMNPRTISVVIPAYNEEKRLGQTLESLRCYFASHAFLPEVIIVDDGSIDDTVGVVRRYQQAMPFLKLVELQENHGKGYAVRMGMREAQGEYRLFMDADNSVDISNLDTFLPYAQNHVADVIIASIEVGNVTAREHNGMYRRALSRLSKLPVRLFITSEVKDTQRGFKLFTKQAAESIFSRQTIDRFGFDIEIVAITLAHRFSIKEVPVEWDNPEGSTVTIGSYFTTLYELAKIVLNKATGAYDVIPFNTEKEAYKGRGFTYKNKEFIHHSSLPHEDTAFWVALYYQKIIIVAAALVIGICLIAHWHATLVVLFSVLTIYIFSICFLGDSLFIRASKILRR